MLGQLMTRAAGRFHALWELYQPPRHRARPTAESASNEHLAAKRAQALLEVSVGTGVWRDFTKQREIIQRCRTEVYGYKLHTGGYDTRMET